MNLIQMESAMAKQYASDICLEVVNEALQIHGGTGYLKTGSRKILQRC